MQTLENGMARKSLVTDLLIEKLKTFDNVQVEIHSISNPAYPVLLLSSETEFNWKTQTSTQALPGQNMGRSYGRLSFYFTGRMDYLQNNGGP